MEPNPKGRPPQAPDQKSKAVWTIERYGISSLELTPTIEATVHDTNGGFKVCIMGHAYPDRFEYAHHAKTIAQSLLQQILDEAQSRLPTEAAHD